MQHSQCFGTLRIVHIISGLEIADGGPSYSVPRLKDALIRSGIKAAVFSDLTPGDSANDGSDQVYSFRRNFGRVPILGKFHFSRDLARRVYDDFERIDLIHSHGLWRMPNIYAGKGARYRRVPHVVSPRGMLSEAALRRSAGSKKLFWHIAQKSALENATCFHATSSVEFADIRKFGIKAPVAIIPNGVDLPDEALVRRLGGPRRHSAERTLLYLGRIHPIKGLNDLLVAWSNIEHRFPNWRLRIVGPGEQEHLESLRDVLHKLQVRRVSIESPVFGIDKWRMIFGADLSILPSYTENFGIAVAESLACGRAVITTKGTPWKEIKNQKFGWWIDPGASAIEATLRVALSTPVEQLDDMGARGAAWVKATFAWNDIGENMARVYHWLCLGTAKPDFVALN